MALSSGNLLARKVVRMDSPNLAMEEQEANPDRNNAIIFSNLGPTKSDKYDSRTFAKLTVAGRDSLSEPETWVAVNFIPKRDVQARVLLAAITYISGTKLVNLGLYDDDDGEVGNPLPGGQGSTTEIPVNGECCKLAKVTLAGSGVTLTAGTRYWLVGSPDNVNGATFTGSWHTSNKGISAQYAPPTPWLTASGGWPAGEVRGAPLSDTAQHRDTDFGGADANGITIFNNLGSTPTERFYPGLGNYVSGKDSEIGAESWLALPFIPRVNCHAKTLAAAIGYVSGDMKVNVGIYDDNDGTVGTLLPGGQGSTTNVPAYPSCCDLTKVVLPGAGVALAANAQYWLVVSTDDVHAPSFEGIWRETTVYSNWQQPEFFFWTFVASHWLAAEIRGTAP